jgi:hypothetical protein
MGVYCFGLNDEERGRLKKTWIKVIKKY